MHRLVACSNSPDKQQFALSLTKQFSWWKPHHAERDLSGGLDCIAPYRPLRGFYCDLHINEHCLFAHVNAWAGNSVLSVLQRLIFAINTWNTQVFALRARTHGCACKYVCERFVHTWWEPALWPCAQIDEQQLANWKAIARGDWVVTNLFIPLLCMCVVLCVHSTM